MDTEDGGSVWVFLQSEKPHPGGVFSSRAKAEVWIRRYKLSGVLTAYPLDCGVFDWAIEQGYFVPTKPHHTTAGFVGGFTTARMEHVHFEDGQRVS